MSAKSKKPFLTLLKKALVYLGTIAITLGFSYLMITAGKFVDSGLEITGYLFVLFALLPIVSFFVVSGYFYILERFNLS